ncbi:hypothetical protein EDB19DRAFT_1782753, partial [Suillus lakei]
MTSVIIKTIRHTKHKFFLRLLRQYWEHFKTNSHTLSSRPEEANDPFCDHEQCVPCLTKLFTAFSTTSSSIPLLICVHGAQFCPSDT